jgi:hypothetical protein
MSLIMKRKMGSTLFALAGLALACGTLQARTWKSSDGSKSFDAELVEYADGKVTVKTSSGRKMTFKESVLSADDQAFLKEEAERLEKEAAAKAEAEKLATAEIPSTLDGNLVKLSGKSFKKYEPETPSKYYLLYFSASW